MNTNFHQLVFGFKGNGAYGLRVWGQKPGVDLPLFAVMLAKKQQITEHGAFCAFASEHGTRK
jgi:hypothetical protein